MPISTFGEEKVDEMKWEQVTDESVDEDSNSDNVSLHS